MNPWISLLKKMDLSRTEQEVVRRFEADPMGRSFLPVADILRAYRYADESLELLIYGVMHHPTFTVSRIVLVRELLQKGMVTEAWKTLDESKSSLKENVLAQKLMFRLAILLEFEAIARETYRHMKTQQMMDPDITEIGEFFEVSGIHLTRDRLITEMTGHGIKLILPLQSKSEGASIKNQSVKNIELSAAGSEINHEIELPGFRELPEIQEAQEFEEDRFGGFRVIALSEIFQGADDQDVMHSGPGGIELDSSTLAGIYEHQGHFEKALAVYRRLLRLTPSNNLIKTKISELASKRQRQKNDDLVIDPAIADSMEQVEIIDVQVKFYQSLLERLNQ